VPGTRKKAGTSPVRGGTLCHCGMPGDIPIVFVENVYPDASTFLPSS
jgi:hypothetical protein